MDNDKVKEMVVKGFEATLDYCSMVKKRYQNRERSMWLGKNTCACKCGWVADPDPAVRDEVIDACQDEIRTCKKCGTRYQRKSLVQ